MPKRLMRSVCLALGASALLVGCNSDHTPVAPSAPATPAVSPSLLGGLLGGLTTTVVGVVDRVVPLPSDVTWSFVAGPGGARSSNSVAGLSIYVPPGALSSNVTITVTAVHGSVVNYHFEPEGLKFASPVVLTQDMSLTTTLLNLLTASSMHGAYYSSPTLQYDPSTNTATVNELEPTSTNLLDSSVSWQIRHFSGYILASCNSSDW